MEVRDHHHDTTDLSPEKETRTPWNRCLAYSRQCLDVLEKRNIASALEKIET
jgi:hypothetical protein